MGRMVTILHVLWKVTSFDSSIDSYSLRYTPDCFYDCLVHYGSYGAPRPCTYRPSSSPSYGRPSPSCASVALVLLMSTCRTRSNLYAPSCNRVAYHSHLRISSHRIPIPGTCQACRHWIVPGDRYHWGDHRCQTISAHGHNRRRNHRPAHRHHQQQQSGKKHYQLGSFTSLGYAAFSFPIAATTSAAAPSPITISFACDALVRGSREVALFTPVSGISLYANPSYHVPCAQSGMSPPPG